MTTPRLTRALGVACLLAMTTRPALAQDAASTVPTLVGLAIGTARPGSAAFIVCPADAASSRARMVFVGERACEATVEAIDADGVILRTASTDALVHLELSNTVTLRPTASTHRAATSASPALHLPAPEVTRADDRVHVTMTAARLEAYLSDLPALLTSGTAVPHAHTSDAQPRVIDGFQVIAVTAGSLIDQVGIRPGDIVSDVNGAPLRDVASLPLLLSDLKAARHATLGLRRGDSRVLVVVDIQ